MPLYRILCVGRTSASRDGRIPKLVKKLADDVVNGGGSFQNVESLGNRKLAFKFSQKQGYVSTFFYVFFLFSLSFKFSLCVGLRRYYITMKVDRVDFTLKGLCGSI